MRRDLVVGIAGVLVLVAVGVASLWWLVDTVRTKSSEAPLSDPRVIAMEFAIDGVLVGADDRHVTVFSSTQVCGVPHLDARESPDKIVFAIKAPDPSSSSCQGKPFAGPYRTVLADRVATRRFVDAFGQPVERVDTADVLQPRYLPTGYRAGPLEISSGGTVQRRFTRAGSPLEIDLEQGPGAVSDESGLPDGHAVVDGVTADVFRTLGSVDVRWTVGTWHVSVSVDGHPATVGATALRVARSMS